MLSIFELGYVTIFLPDSFGTHPTRRLTHIVPTCVKESLHHKYKIPLEDLDLSREIVPITDKLEDASELVDLLFLILTNEEIDELKPSNLNVGTQKNQFPTVTLLQFVFTVEGGRAQGKVYPDCRTDDRMGGEGGSNRRAWYGCR